MLCGAGWLWIAPGWAEQRAACPPGGVHAPLKPGHIEGIVVGPAPPEEVARQTQIAEARTGGSVSPDYVALPRILVDFVSNGVRSRTIAAVVDGPVPARGTVVILATRRRDPRDPCHFIPWTVEPPGVSV